MNVGVIKSSKVCGNPYLLGLSWGGTQLRIGLILVHIVIIFD